MGSSQFLLRIGLLNQVIFWQKLVTYGNIDKLCSLKLLDLVYFMGVQLCLLWWGIFWRIQKGKNFQILIITSCTPTKQTWSNNFKEKSLSNYPKVDSKLMIENTLKYFQLFIWMMVWFQNSDLRYCSSLVSGLKKWSRFPDTYNRISSANICRLSLE